MAGRMQVRANRLAALLGVVAGTALVSFAGFSFSFFDLAFVQPGDPPIVVAVNIWPLEPVKFAVGLVFGPIAGAATGIASGLIGAAQGGQNPLTTWNWLLAAGLGGFVAGWLPRNLPSAWQSSGARRFAGAALTGVVATAVGYLPIFLDPFTRPDVQWVFAFGEYNTLIVPLAVLSALMLPLVLAAALRIHLHPAGSAGGAQGAARPSWRPFALALVVAILAPLVPLYLPSGVRVVGASHSASGPAAAPAPGAISAVVRDAYLSLGAPLTADRSCDAEGNVRSPYSWSIVEVTLRNETDTTIGLTWVNYDGKRDEVIPVDPGGDPGVGEWVTGHVFMLTGPDDACLMIFKVQGTTPITIHLRS
jgi:hypothetical protein